MHCPPYQNEIISGVSTIVELVPDGEYLARDYDDTQENLGDIGPRGDTHGDNNSPVFDNT